MRVDASSPRSPSWVAGEGGDGGSGAVIALHGLFGVWLGSTLGMVTADALAILLGQQLGARLPERAIRIVATVAFVVFGIVLLIEGIRS